MAVYYVDESQEDSLEHHGILGQKWGVRRYQNPDGSLTAEGKERYYGTKETAKLAKKVGKTSGESFSNGIGGKAYYHDPIDSLGRDQRAMRSPQIKAIAVSARNDYKIAASSKKKMEEIEKSVLNKGSYKELAKKAAERDFSKRSNDKDISLSDLIEVYRQSDGMDLYKGRIVGTYGFKWWLNHSGDYRVKDYKEYAKQYETAYKRYQKKCESLIKEYLGSHSNDKIGHTTLTDKAQVLVDQIMQTWDGYENDWNNGVPASILDIPKLLL